MSTEFLVQQIDSVLSGNTLIFMYYCIMYELGHTCMHYEAMFTDGLVNRGRK